jgi:hypothetical protein
MKQYLIQFSALLIILLVGGASAIENTGNANYTLLSYTGSNASITYDCGGFVKMGDVVTITATFNEPVLSAAALVGLVPLSSNEFPGNSSTVWTFTYDVPAGINDVVDVTVYGAGGNNGPIEETDVAAFVVDNEKPILKKIDPSSNPVYTKCALFEFIAFDRLDNTLNYTIYINGTEDESGTVSSNGNVTYEPDLADGYYLLNITLEDDAGNIGASDIIDLYVDSKDPIVTPVYPQNLTVVTESPLLFNFTAVDSFSANYSLEMAYQLYIDGELYLPGSGNMNSGEYREIQYAGLSDGVHNWSVTVEDKAGNNCSGKVQDFYVNCNGLDVYLNSPTGGFVPANATFNFSVAGGAGLPFNYDLLVNGTKVKNGTAVIEEDGVNNISVEATLADGVNMPWTVNVTDCAGNVSVPVPPFYSISVDTTAPAPVANLSVTDAIGDTTWYYVYDEPGLYVRWDKNTEPDLAGYLVYISDSEPSSIEDMEPAVPVSQVFDNETFMSMYIGTYGGKTLVYGKDYWVVVVSLDIAGNADFNMCGPVQTYEDMNIALDAGWNLKSVPKRLATFNADACSAFGDNSTVIYWNGNCWEFPKTIEPCKGYWVYSPEACEINVKFKPMPISSASPDVPASLNLASGWQMIGHTSTVPVEWSTTLSSLRGSLNGYKYSNLVTYSQDEGWGGIIPDTDYYIILVGENETSFNGTGPASLLQTDGYMAPGQGYWIFMTENGTYASIENVDVYAV